MPFLRPVNHNGTGPERPIPLLVVTIYLAGSVAIFLSTSCLILSKSVRTFFQNRNSVLLCLTRGL